MHENAPVITAKPRPKIGSRYSKRVRDAGGLPAIVYGHGETPVPISVDARDTLRHIHKGERVYQLELDGASPQTVLLKEVQFDHLGTQIIHADFARVSLTDRVHTRVPVHLVGQAVGLKTAGAILMHPTGELEIECAVKDIPDHVEVDISALEADQMITADKVKLPLPDMKLITDEHAVVAQIVIQMEAPVAEATTVAAEPGQPEVITERKPKDEEGGAADAKKAAPEKKEPKKG